MGAFESSEAVPEDTVIGEGEQDFVAKDHGSRGKRHERVNSISLAGVSLIVQASLHVTRAACVLKTICRAFNVTIVCI